ALYAVRIDDPGAGHRLHGLRHQLDVLLLERGIEGAGQDRPLAGIGILRRDGFAQVRAVGELARDVVEADPLARLVGAGAGPVGVPAAQVLLHHELEPPALRVAPPRARERGAFGVGEVALALGDDPSGLALEYVEALHDRLDR